VLLTFKQTKNQHETPAMCEKASNAEIQRYDTEELNAIDISSMPPSCLRLYLGQVCMLVRNICSPGAFNGSRLRITCLRYNYIEGDLTGTVITIPRILFIPKRSDINLPVQFYRRQFPLRPAYALSINKAQRIHHCLLKLLLYLHLSTQHNIHILHSSRSNPRLCRPAFD